MVGAVGHLPCFKDLIAVLFECFLIISLGYLSCRFKLITNQAKDLNSYLTTFALPMIIFLNIAQMEFHTINLSFLFCMLIAKLLVFISVTVLTITMSYPMNFGYAGSLSILATQSNDFALGYPLIKSLYGDSKMEMLNYLSLMAPIQLLILNPLGIAMLEYHKSKQVKEKSNSEQPINSVCQDCKRSISPKSPTLMNQNQIIQQHQSRSNLKHTQNAAQATSNNLLNATFSKQRLSLAPRDRIRNNYDDTISEKNSNKPPVKLSSSGFKQRNVKSLTLTIPTARIDIIESDSEESMHALNESPPQAQSTQLTNNNNAPSLTNRLSQVPDERIYERNSPLVDLVENSNFRSNSPGDIMPYCSCPATNVCIRIIEPKINFNFLVALATNPLIIASVVALMVNLIHGPELPKFVTRVSNTIAASFASPALFVVGLSMYGKFELLLRNPGDLLLSSVLVLTKVLLLPSLMRTLALTILPHYTPPEELAYLIDFSFLYGLLPTAPTACIIAKQYGVLSNVVSISMLLSTFISAPLMLGSAVIINPSSVINVMVLENIISQTMKISSVITFILTFLTLYGFWKTKMNMNYNTFANIPEAVCARINKFRANPMHIFLFLLTISQIMIGFGGLTWYFINSSPIDDGNHSTHPTRLFDSGPENNINENLTNLHLGPETMSIASMPLDPTDLEPSPMGEPVESWVIPVNFNFGLKTLFRMQYVLSSFGLIMSRFAIMCIILAMASSRFVDPLRTSKLSSLMIKAYIIFGTSSIIWLIFDSERLRHLPVEPSLPSQSVSLYLRFLYNLVILIVSIPIFALTVRFDNKKRKESTAETIHVSEDCSESTDNEVATSFVKRRFVTSSASLSSDTSSALTSNTNLELIVGLNPVIISDANNNNQQPQPTCDTMSIVLDGGPYDVRRPASPNEGQTIVNQATLFGSYGSTATDIRTGANNENGYHPTGRPYDSEEPTINGINLSHDNTGFSVKEFNKYSILIVFMLIDSMLNLTSIAQKLLQDQPFGTFKQIEVLNVAMEFGQGFLTFLIYGTRGRL